MDCVSGSDRSPIVVIGIGNDLRHDDATGREVVRRLARRAEQRPMPAGISLRMCDGDPGRLISLWEGADLAVVIDAVRDGEERPGRIHRLEPRGTWEEPHGTTSSHGLGLSVALGLARRLDRLPDRLVLYAVAGADFSLGSGLSEPVARAVGVLAEQIEAEISPVDGSMGGSVQGWRAEWAGQRRNCRGDPRTRIETGPSVDLPRSYDSGGPFGPSLKWS